MIELLVGNETAVRLAVFAGVLAVMALFEVAVPRRRREIPRLLRWGNNLAIVALDALLVRLVFPILAVGMALVADARGWGLLNTFDAPMWVSIPATLVVFDFAIYLQHVLFHRVPVLWRVHRMHHADLEFDVTTGLRFHPVEIALSMGIKLGLVVVFGPPAVAVLLFEVLLNASSMFNHSNVRIPGPVDRVLRWFVVTPDMHRVHHSIHPSETNSNFGFNLPWWDRLLGTYTAQPRDTHEGMAIGVGHFRTRRDLWIDRMLVQPWKDETEE